MPSAYDVIVSGLGAMERCVLARHLVHYGRIMPFFTSTHP
jgi:hypothetical protein